jgi:hypothetical protein
MQDDTQETEIRQTTTRDGNTNVQKQTVARSSQVSFIVIIQRIVWFIVGLINIIIALRFVFLLLGANKGAGFTDFIYSTSAPLVSPFVGIFGEPAYGQSVFEVSSILAVVIYTLIGWGIAKLITLTRPQDEI